MLLDRKKIRKWAKWVALGLAIVFALSFLFMGVGYGGAGFNLSELFTGGDDSDTTEPLTDQERLEEYLKTLETNKEDTATMLAVATIYEDLYEAGEGDQYLTTAAAFLENAIDVDPSLKDVYIRLADIYMIKMQNNEAAVVVLNKAASVDPNNPEVFLKLGTAQKNSGNIAAAVMAWQKYLELDPNGPYAEVIQDQLNTLTATTTTTVAAPAATTATTAE